MLLFVVVFVIVFVGCIMFVMLLCYVVLCYVVLCYVVLCYVCVVFCFSDQSFSQLNLISARFAIVV